MGLGYHILKEEKGFLQKNIPNLAITKLQTTFRYLLKGKWLAFHNVQTFLIKIMMQVGRVMGKKLRHHKLSR